MDYPTFGRHVAVDAWGISFELLNNHHRLEEFLLQAAEICGATVITTRSTQFDPQGVSVLVMLSESHISIHTYPEKGFAALDCYTCGHTVNPETAIQFLLNKLQPTQIYSKLLHRGVGEIRVIDIVKTD